jgi:cobalt-zinc-cadmium efflux system outer membrane protein
VIRLLICTVALWGCSVPKRAGFDDVQKLVRERGVERIHWNQGTAEDAEVDRLVGELVARPLTPKSAVEIALLNNPRLQATYEKLGVAQADVVQAGLLKNPSFSLGIGFPITSGIGTEYEFSLVQDFLDLFLIPLKKRFARAEHEAAKLEVADAVLALQAEVREAFYSVEGAQQIVELSRALSEAAQASAELAERQRQAGNVSALDAVEEQALSAQTHLDLLRAEEELRDAREHLTRLLGLWGPRARWHIEARLEELPPSSAEASLDDLEPRAVARRLDVQLARRRVENARAAIPVARAGVIGGLELGAQGHQDPDHDGRVLGPSLRLEIPIFDQHQALLFKLRARLRAAERTLDAVTLEARSEVRAARDHLLATRAIVDYYRLHALPLRERTVVLAQEQYNAMLLGVFQLLSAKQAQIRTYREYLTSVRDYFIARAQLERAAGGPIK